VRHLQYHECGFVQRCLTRNENNKTRHVNKQTTELAIHDPKITEIVENIFFASLRRWEKCEKRRPPPPSRQFTKEHKARAGFT
jgi:hypothetical protein